MPGDEVIAQPRYQTTHAITIHAPPSQVWPWLVQLGQGRGGLYSYDWLENLVGLGFCSADRILPELQTLAVGIRCGWRPEFRRCRCGTRSWTSSHRRHWCWVPTATARRPWPRACPGRPGPFVLRALGNGSSRLLVRMRSDFKPTLLGLVANKYALEPVHFAMEPKMLLGIKERAEQAAAT